MNLLITGSQAQLAPNSKRKPCCKDVEIDPQNKGSQKSLFLSKANYRRHANLES